MMKNILVYFLVGFACMNAIIGQENEVEPIDVDVCVYGGTAAGVIAAIQSAKLGHNVVIIEPGRHIGGIAVDGLGGTDVNNHRDFKNSSAIGGMALDFYKKSIAQNDFTESEFFEVFEEDLHHLINQGVEREDVPIMLDQLRYFVEE